MNPLHSRLLALALVCMAPHAAGAQPADDPRINLKLTPEERVEFLAEMRHMLGSIQGVMQGIGDADRERIAAAARQSGNRMARATPVSVRAKLPQSFRDLGGPTHMMFDLPCARKPTTWTASPATPQT